MLMVSTPLKKKKKNVNGKDDIPYIMENKIHVWNHQPVFVGLSTIIIPIN